MRKRGTTRRKPKLAELKFRVYRIPKTLKSQLVKARHASGATVEAFVNSAVENNLATVVDAVGTALGAKAAGEAAPVRLPLRTTSLEALAAAAAKTGLPGSQLLLACLAKICVHTSRRRKSKSE